MNILAEVLAPSNNFNAKYVWRTIQSTVLSTSIRKIRDTGCRCYATSAAARNIKSPSLYQSNGEAPVTVEEFDELIQKLKLIDAPFGVAISGGPDSAALSLLAHDWAKLKSRRMVAITVDHKVRRESTEEAQHVGNLLRERGIDHRLVSCEWPRGLPVAAPQVAYRKQRYIRIGEISRELGLRYILMAHHRDDQTETFLMRFSHGSGTDGLACMDPISPINPSLAVVRPFLSISKSRLVATCEAYKFPYVIDPSNQSMDYMRNVIRDGIKNASSQISPERIIDVIEYMHEAKSAMQREVKLFYAHSAVIIPKYCAAVRVDTLQKLPKPTAIRVINGIIHRLTNNHQMHLEQLENLYKFFGFALDRKTVKVTSGGLIWQKASTRLQQILVTREPKAVPDIKIEIKVGERIMWDNYFYITFSNKPYSAHKLKSPSEQETEIERDDTNETAPAATTTTTTTPTPTPPPPTSFVIEDDLLEDGIPRYNNPLTPFPKHIFEGLEDDEPAEPEPEISGPPITRAYVRKMEDKDLRDLLDIHKWAKRLPLPKPNCYSFPVVEDEYGNLLSIPQLEFCARRDISFVCEPVDISVAENEHVAEVFANEQPVKKKK